MKKLILTLALVAGATFGIAARDTITTDTSVLPVAAQIALQNSKSEVNQVKVDKSFGHIENYEVTLTDGTEITFDRNGNWTSIEPATPGAIPSGIIATEVLDYVSNTQPDAKVTEIERERTGNFEVTLSNGIEMKFDRHGEFLKYDK